MKIMHLLKSSFFSGAENVVCQIISLFKNEPGFEMVYVSPDGPIRKVLEEKKIVFYPLSCFNRRNIEIAIETIKPDVIHAHDFSASVMASFQKDVRVFSHLHNNPLWFPKLCIKSIVYRCCIFRFEKIIGVSNAIYKEYYFRKSLKSKFFCLPNVVETNSVLEKSKVGGVTNVDILYVGRLAEPKNPLRFLEIVKEIYSRTELDLKTVMVGTGPLRNKCKQAIKNYNLENKVKMVGFEENPYKYMAASKILIIPSIYEGFGLVAIEAMSLGKVVLGTPVGGLADILRNGGGEVCNTNEIFVKKAIYYLNDSNARTKKSNLAIKRANMFSDVNQYKDTLKALYTSRRCK